MTGHDWLHTLAHLGPNKQEERGVAPHKPILVLALLDLIEEGLVRTPQVQLNPTLVERFSKYWNAAAVPRWEEKAWMPFYHLQGRLWSLVAQPGMEHELTSIDKVHSNKQTQKLIAHARLEEGFWHFVQSPDNRQRARLVLIREYFQADAQSRLVEAVSEESQAACYADGLLKRALTPFVAEWEDAQSRTVSQTVRQAAFRRTIRLLYDESCTLCGLRLLAVNGHSLCDAAHIVPYSQFSNDDPRNGLGLCPVHHWCFDEGLFTITSDYRVSVSPTLDPDRPTEERLADMDGTIIRLPKEKHCHPALEALAWHQEHRLLTA